MKENHSYVLEVSIYSLALHSHSGNDDNIK